MAGILIGTPCTCPRAMRRLDFDSALGSLQRGRRAVRAFHRRETVPRQPGDHPRTRSATRRRAAVAAVEAQAADRRRPARRDRSRQGAGGAVPERACVPRRAPRRRADVGRGRGRSRGTTMVAIGTLMLQKPPPTWDDETLRTAEHELARALGPMAKVIVHRAAAQTTDRAELCSILSGSIVDPDMRRKLRRGVRARRPRAAFARGSGVRARARHGTARHRRAKQASYTRQARTGTGAAAGDGRTPGGQRARRKGLKCAARAGS